MGSHIGGAHKPDASLLQVCSDVAPVSRHVPFSRQPPHHPCTISPPRSKPNMCRVLTRNLSHSYRPTRGPLSHKSSCPVPTPIDLYFDMYSILPEIPFFRPLVSVHFGFGLSTQSLPRYDSQIVAILPLRSSSCTSYNYSVRGLHLGFAPPLCSELSGSCHIAFVIDGNSFIRSFSGSLFHRISSG